MISMAELDEQPIG